MNESQSQDSNNVPTTDPFQHRGQPLVIISEEKETELDIYPQLELNQYHVVNTTALPLSYMGYLWIQCIMDSM